MRSWVATCLFALVSLAAAAPAEACVTCGVGDPTLTVMGAGQPVAGRLRLSLELQGRWDELATEDNPAMLVEGSTILAISYAPIDRVAISLSMPLLLRDLRYGEHAHYTTLGPGDLEVRGRFVLLSDRTFAPENQLGVTAGVRLPTSVDHVGPDGALLPFDAQSGAGAVAPILGVYYSHFEDPWSVFGSATVALPFAGRFADAPGPSFGTTLAVQYRFDRWITVRAAADLRLDAPVMLDGVTAPGTEHYVLFLSPDLLWAPISDLIVALGVRAPVVQHSPQGRIEGWYFRVALIGDLAL